MTFRNGAGLALLFLITLFFCHSSFAEPRRGEKYNAWKARAEKEAVEMDEIMKRIGEENVERAETPGAKEAARAENERMRADWQKCREEMMNEQAPPEARLEAYRGMLKRREILVGKMPPEAAKKLFEGAKVSEATQKQLKADADVHFRATLVEIYGEPSQFPGAYKRAFPEFTTPEALVNYSRRGETNPIQDHQPVKGEPAVEVSTANIDAQKKLNDSKQVDPEVQKQWDALNKLTEDYLAGRAFNPTFGQRLRGTLLPFLFPPPAQVRASKFSKEAVRAAMELARLNGTPWNVENILANAFQKGSRPEIIQIQMNLLMPVLMKGSTTFRNEVIANKGNAEKIPESAKADVESLTKDMTKLADEINTAMDKVDALRDPAKGPQLEGKALEAEMKKLADLVEQYAALEMRLKLKLRETPEGRRFLDGETGAEANAKKAMNDYAKSKEFQDALVKKLKDKGFPEREAKKLAEEARRCQQDSTCTGGDCNVPSNVGGGPALANPKVIK